MKRFLLLLTLALGVFGPMAATATTVIGDLNNFDTINDTGQVCYGFEIELDDVVSTDITYTFDWNHYGAPKIYEVAIDDPNNPQRKRVIVRYESTKDANGTWGANGSFTNPAIPSLGPPSGHTCTDTSVNEGCEHFGLGYYGTPSAVRYNWLVDDSQGGLVRHGTPVGVAAPKFNYLPPAAGAPAQVVAAIPAPVAPVAGKAFGEAFWVKVIKTTTHNVRPVRLDDLISDDADADGLPDWTNGEPDEVETEWKLLQRNDGANAAKDEFVGAADPVAEAGEQVTRRYEFYRYGAAANTLDGETGEAMCDEVDTTTDPSDPYYLHGKRTMTEVGVTDANGDTQRINCAAQVVVGAYIGAQMAGFAAAAPLGLIDNLQDGERDVLYTARTVIVGGDTPFTIAISGGALPGGMSIDPDSGVLAGTPTSGGDFAFTLDVTDASGATAQRGYTLRIAGLPAAAYGVVYNGNGHTGGAVPIDANGPYAPGTAVTVASAGTLVRTGYTFTSWNTVADGTGAGYAAGATLTMPAANVTLYAKWSLNSYTVSFDSQGGSAVSSQTVDYNGKATKPTDPTRAGYAFGGWYTNSPPTTAYDFNTAVTGTLTLYAKWTSIKYSVTYDGNGALGGSVPLDGGTYAPGATVTVLGNTGNLTKTGYVFAGWNTQSGGGGTSYGAGSQFTMGSVNVTLYAAWVQLPTVQFGAAAYSVDEAGGSITIAVTRTGNTAGTSTVAWATANGSASAGTDYTGASGTLTFNPGVTSLNIAISVANDTVAEADETFTVALSNPSGATLGAPASTTVTIVDNDGGAALTSDVAIGGLAGAKNSLTYFHIDVPAGMGSLNVATSGGSGNVDVYVRAGVLPTTTTYACRSTGRTNADTCTVTNPAAGRWYVMLRGTSAYSGASLVASYAPPPPPAVQFTASSIGVNDNVGTVSFTVTRVGNSALAASVAWATANGTALAGTDYTASSGTLNWAAGDATAKTFTVPITSRKGTQSPRSFTVSLSAPVNVGLGTPATATVTVQN